MLSPGQLDLDEKKIYVEDVDFLHFFRQTDVWRWQFPPPL